MAQLRLEDINTHPRDKNITFIEEGHIYKIKGLEGNPCSTTQTISKYHSHFDADKILDKMYRDGIYIGKNPKYINLTREEAKKSWVKASENGTLGHKDIENYFNGDPIENPNSKGFLMFMDFWKTYTKKYPGHKPYRTEWLVYCDDPNCTNTLAGSIDFVVEDANGDLRIIDWKFVEDMKKENSYYNKYIDETINKKMYKPFQDLDDCNFNHYSLQLNFYRHILETLYQKHIVDMRLVKLHPNQEKYEEYEIDRRDLSNIWCTLR